MSIQSLYPALKPSLNLDFANTKVLDPRITFSRASTATYYDGKTVAKAEENLATNSNLFTSTLIGVTVETNAFNAPDGTLSATRITVDTSTGHHLVERSYGYWTSGNVYTFSIYVKSNTATTFGIRESGYGNSWASYNLSTVSVSSSAGCTTSITAVQNGWLRISYTCTAPFSGNASFQIGTQGFTSFTGNGTDSVYVCWSQLEQRSAVSSYTPTTSSAITNYIPALQTAAANVARFDHDPITGESKGLLIEEQRTNLLTYSSDFSNSAWSKTNSTVTTDSVVSPDGLQTADLLSAGTTSGSQAGFAVTSAITVTAQAYTISIRIKSAGVQYFQLWAGGSAWSGYANIDIVNGSVGSTSGCTATVNAIGNGWFNVSVSFTAAAGSLYPWFSFVSASTSGRASAYQGNGYSGAYIWGAQLEAGSFATSYIPTTSAQVTRSADSASMTGSNFSSWYSMGQGAAYIEGSGAYCFEVHNGAATNYANYWIIGDISATGVDRFMSGNNSSVDQWNSRQFSTKALKMAMVFAPNDAAGYYNGVQQFTDTSVIPPANIDTAYISYARTGWVKRIAYYPARLTNTQLQALTS